MIEGSLRMASGGACGITSGHSWATFGPSGSDFYPTTLSSRNTAKLLKTLLDLIGYPTIVGVAR